MPPPTTLTRRPYALVDREAPWSKVYRPLGRVGLAGPSRGRRSSGPRSSPKGGTDPRLHELAGHDPWAGTGRGETARRPPIRFHRPVGRTGSRRAIRGHGRASPKSTERPMARRAPGVEEKPGEHSWLTSPGRRLPAHNPRYRCRRADRRGLVAPPSPCTRRSAGARRRGNGPTHRPGRQ